MPVETRSDGDLFDCGVQAITNAINCCGVMGRGIALEFKHRYPAMFREYVRQCAAKHIRPGQLWVWREGEQYIFNFPTKDDWRNSSKLEWIAAGLDDLKSHVTMNGIRSVAMPALGCSNGGLKFADVEPLVYEKLNDLDQQIILFKPR